MNEWKSKQGQREREKEREREEGTVTSINGYIMETFACNTKAFKNYSIVQTTSKNWMFFSRL